MWRAANIGLNFRCTWVRSVWEAVSLHPSKQLILLIRLSRLICKSKTCRTQTYCREFEVCHTHNSTIKGLCVILGLSLLTENKEALCYQTKMAFYVTDSFAFHNDGFTGKKIKNPALWIRTLGKYTLQLEARWWLIKLIVTEVIKSTTKIRTNKDSKCASYLTVSRNRVQL